MSEMTSTEAVLLWELERDRPEALPTADAQAVAMRDLLHRLVKEYEDGDCDLQSLTREAREVLGMPPR